MKLEDVKAFIQQLPIKYHITPIGIKAQRFGANLRNFTSIRQYNDTLATMKNPEEARLLLRTYAEPALIDRAVKIGVTRSCGIRASMALAHILSSIPEVQAILDAITYADIHRIERLRQWVQEKKFRLVPEEDTPDAYKE